MPVRSWPMRSLLLILLPACAAPAQTVTPHPKLAGLRESWLSAMKEIDVPGAAVVVVKDDKVILLESMGVRDVASQEPVTADTIFYIASCTKSLNAMAALALVGQGKLELDAPVER